VLPSGALTYSPVVSNVGGATTTVVTFTEKVPANTTFVSMTPPAVGGITWSGANCATPSGGTITCTSSAGLTSGYSGTFALKVTANSGDATGTQLTDLASATAASGGTSSASATSTVAGAATLGLSTTAPSTVAAGNNIIYTNVVTNGGPGATSSTTLTVPIPANTTYQSSAPPAGWTCAYISSPSEVQCTDSSGLPSGASVSIPVMVTTLSTTAAGTIITDPTTVTATTGGTANSSASTTVNPSVNLVVSNTAVQTAANIITYTQTLQNIGPSTAAAGAITLTQYVPTGSTVAYTSWPAGWTCGTTVANTVNCGTTPAMGQAGSATCTNTTAPMLSNALAVSFTMTLTGVAGTVCEWDGAMTAYESYPPDNIASAPIAVVPMADVDPAISAAVGTPSSGSNLYPGGSLVENFTVTNNGPSTIISNGGTQSLTFTLAPSNVNLPENWTTYATYSSVPATPAAGWSCSYASGTNTVTCTLNSGSSLAPGASVTIPVTLKVNSNTISGTIITATGLVTVAGYTDSTPGNNYLQAQNTVSPGLADLAWTTSTATALVAPGANITYNLVLTNNGPSDSLGTVTVSDTLPTNTTFVSMTTPTGWACTDPAVGSAGTITCTIPDFLAGATATFNPVFKVAAGITTSPITNTISAAPGATTDPVLTNNSASQSTNISIAADVDLGVTNTPPSPATVSAGNNITFTQVFTNYGGAATSGTAGAQAITETIPPNTTFVSFGPTTGLTCSLPAVGATGTFTCTNTAGASMPVNTSATFTFVVQVNPGTPDGTVINDTVSVSTTSTDPNLANNTATATVQVIDSKSASVTIGMTPPTQSVLAGNNSSYTITVTNTSSTVTATNVVVTDVIPELGTDGQTANQLTFVSATPSVGTCSQASGTVTCELGAMAPLATATITLVTETAVPTIFINPASVVADQQTTPQNASVQTIVSAPTSVTLKSFVAGYSGSNVVLQWKTSGELHNLGFNVYREVNGTRVRINSSLVAGSALRMKGELEQHAASSYSWIDRAPQPGAVYWIEDVDVHGARTLHDPALPQPNAALAEFQSSTLAQLRASESTAAASIATLPASDQLQTFAQPSSTPRQQAVQNQLASGPATKIAVDHEGWYSVALQAAAAPSGRYYHLYAEGVEQPIRITGHPASGPGLEFYGTGIDTPYTGSRVYWLVNNNMPSMGIAQAAAPANGGAVPQSFPYTVELKQRTTYFGTLMTSGNHYFGDAVTDEPVNETLTVTNLAPDAPAPVLTVVLQGVIDQTEHQVYVAVNNVGVGVANFYGMNQGTLQVELPPGALQPGANTIMLNALNGDNDVSLLDHIDLQYGHTYTAESDALKFTAEPGEHVTVSGFTQIPSRLIDITDSGAPIELTGNVIAQGAGFALDFAVPSNLFGTRTLLAVAADTISAPQAITYTTGSKWNTAQSGSDVVMISDPTFAPALNPLVQLHRNQGHTVAVVPIADIYDEFNYGEKNPLAIQQFLQTATSRWRNKPRYLLLVGNASVDPRNYLGFGDSDFVPTALVPTAETMMVASDDWFSDFNNSGLAQIPTGRLPVVSLAQASLVVNKIVGYESSSASFSNQVLLVADSDDTESFTQDTTSVQTLLPSSLIPMNIWETLVGAAGPQTIVNQINSGPAIVNYIGHGSESWWSNDLFDPAAAAALTNGNRLPVFLMITCLNGYFNDPQGQSLAAAVLEAPNGGGVAVLASSALLDPAPELQMDLNLWKSLTTNQSLLLGDAIAKAKASISDLDTRRTYILFGDPLLHVRLPGFPGNHTPLSPRAR
jgi:uncharacterized repeat protein (TIGR01451 family)